MGASLPVAVLRGTLGLSRNRSARVMRDDVPMLSPHASQA
jgi:hypothetical protein